MKSQIENAGEGGMRRMGWSGHRGLKSQIENAREEEMGREGERREGERGECRAAGGLKSQIENAGEEWMRRRVGECRGH